MVLLIILSCCEAPPVRIGYGLEAGQRSCDRVFEVWHEPGDPCGVYLDYLLEFFLLSSEGLWGIECWVDRSCRSRVDLGSISTRGG